MMANKYLSPPNRRGSDNGSSRDADGDNPRLGEGASDSMSSGNSSPTQGNSVADNSRNVGESKRGSKAPTNSGAGNWSMESMPQDINCDNTQKPSGPVGRRPEFDSKGNNVYGTGQSKRAPDRTSLSSEKETLTSTSRSHKPDMPPVAKRAKQEGESLATERAEMMGGTSKMKGMNGTRSGGSHGSFHEKRSRY